MIIPADKLSNLWASFNLVFKSFAMRKGYVTLQILNRAQENTTYTTKAFQIFSHTSSFIGNQISCSYFLYQQGSTSYLGQQTTQKFKSSQKIFERENFRHMV